MGGRHVVRFVGRLDDWRRGSARARAGIAIPVDRYDFSLIAASDKPKFFIHGERDELCR